MGIWVGTILWPVESLVKQMADGFACGIGSRDVTQESGHLLESFFICSVLARGATALRHSNSYRPS
jgi:hypothetical protein